MYSEHDLLKGGVAPFGYPRIKACSRLPMAFRSVPRPSSPPGAKASTECPYRAQNPHARSLLRKTDTPAMHRNHPQTQTASRSSQKCKPQTRTKSHTIIFTRAHERLFRGRELRRTQKGSPPLVRLCRPRYAHRRTRTYSITKEQHPRSALSDNRGISTSPNDDTSDRSTETPHTKPRTLVEVDGIEPTTPCLQSRCSPS